METRTTLRKERVGLVVSNKMDKTVVVAVVEKASIPSIKRQLPRPPVSRRTTKTTSAAREIRSE